MGKFMKGCAITALILIVIGFVTAIAAGSVTGGSLLKNVVHDVTGGRVTVDLDDFEDWGVQVGEKVSEQISEGAHYDIEDTMIFNDAFNIFSGDTEKYSVGSDITELKVEVGGCIFRMEKSEDSNFYLEAKNAGKFQGYVENGTLYVRALKNGLIENVSLNGANTCKITIYVPEDFYFEKASLEMGAGSMELDKLNGNEISLEVGAGKITVRGAYAEKLKTSVGMGEIVIDDMEVSKLDAETNMGNLEIEGIVNEKADVECSMGNITLRLDGEKKDFDYDVECGMGAINIDGDSYSGLAQEKHIDYDGSKKINVECAMGNIEILF